MPLPRRFGFRDAPILRVAGAKKVIGKIRVPFLLMMAQDDRLCLTARLLAAGAEKNPAIRFVAPKYGGHCGFVSRHGGQQRFWAEERIVEFCREQLGN